MSETKVVPFAFRDAEALRYNGEEFTADNIPEHLAHIPIPEHLAHIPLGQFEVRHEGRWYRCRGSWVSAAPVVMVWRETREITQGE